MRKVEIFTTPTCHYCHAVKDFFAEKGVQFTEYDVMSNMEKRKEMIEKSGQMGVPVIIIDDKNVVIGFDKGNLSRLLSV